MGEVGISLQMFMQLMQLSGGCGSYVAILVLTFQVRGSWCLWSLKFVLLVLVLYGVGFACCLVLIVIRGSIHQYQSGEQFDATHMKPLRCP